KGINARRKEILGLIDEARTRPLETYTIELALADAITYHGACSLVGGLEQADTTLSKFNGTAGLDAVAANPFFMRENEREEARRNRRANENAAPEAPAPPPETPPAPEQPPPEPR